MLGYKSCWSDDSWCWLICEISSRSWRWFPKERLNYVKIYTKIFSDVKNIDSDLWPTPKNIFRFFSKCSMFGDQPWVKCELIDFILIDCSLILNFDDFFFFVACQNLQDFPAFPWTIIPIINEISYLDLTINFTFLLIKLELFYSFFIALYYLFIGFFF